MSNYGISDGKQKKKIIVIVGAIFIIALGVFAGWHFFKTQEQPKVPVATEEKKAPEMQTDLSLGGLDLGLTFDEMHDRLGQENSSKQDGVKMSFLYDGLKVSGTDNHVTMLVSANDKVETKRGIHQGSTLDEVLQAYGNEYQLSEAEGLQLYEYSFQSMNGEKGILRFTVKSDNHEVDYISVRIAKSVNKQKEESTAQGKKTITITYTGGETTQLTLSQSEITLHVGQKIHLVPRDQNSDAGFLRVMMDNNFDKLGDIVPKDCLRIKSTGKTQPKGAATEFIMTAQAPGEAVFTVVPNYGSWDLASKMTIHIVQ